MVWLPDWKWRQQQQTGQQKWLPDWKWRQQKQQKQWGKQWGKRPNDKIDASKTLWVGGIPGGVDSKALKAHADPCLWAEVYKHKGDGTGAIGYKTAEEAAAAVATLNGSMLRGSSIQCDSWEKQKK